MYSRLPCDFNAISFLHFLHISSLGWWITKDLTTHFKNTAHKPLQSFNFCGGFERDFLYLLFFASWYNLCHRFPRDFDAISLPPFLHISSLGWWITKDIATHCKTLFIKSLRSFNYFFNVLKLISVIFTFYVLYDMHFRILCRLFWIFSTAR